jgi:hypothetical protein
MTDAKTTGQSSGTWRRAIRNLLPCRRNNTGIHHARVSDIKLLAVLENLERRSFKVGCELRVTETSFVRISQIPSLLDIV